MNKAKILVVEDEGVIALDIEEQLQSFGYESVEVVGSGEEAVQRAERSRPDLVLMDVVLEGAMGGLEAAGELRERFGTPVVYIAACADEETLQRAKMTEPFGYISKPIDGRELRSTVETALHKHRLEQQLRESEEKYRTVVERANDGIVIIQDGVVKFANQVLADMWGGTVDSIVGTPFTDYVHPDHLAELVERYTRRMAGEEVPPVYETTLKRKDGNDVRAELNAGLITYQGTPADLVIARDVTQRKQLEQELKERRLYLEGVLSSVPDAIVTLDIGHKILDWNQGAERLFGYTSEEAIGRELDELVAGRDARMFEQARGFTQKVLNGQPVPPAESVRYRKDGTPVDVILAGAPIQVEGALVGVVAAYIDITERKRAEEAQRRHTEQLEALHEVGLELTSELNLDELLQSIVSRAVELVDANAGGFDLCRPEQGVLDFVIHTGYDTLPSDTGLRLGEGLAGKIWETGKSIIVDDYAAWAGNADVWADHVGHSANMGVPVQWGDEFLGVLEV
ncbi:MAG: PAS domain S-box protein, partial [Anaerolineae bacterium]